jgi:hypothetical protein
VKSTPLFLDPWALFAEFLRYKLLGLGIIQIVEQISSLSGDTNIGIRVQTTFRLPSS